MAYKVIMPQLGESVVEGTVIQWLKQVGDTVEEYEALVEVNTDKVDTEIPSPAAGTILKILVPPETTVKAGRVLCWVGEPGEEIPEESDDALGPTDMAQLETPSEVQAKVEVVTSPKKKERGFISPVVSRIASEKGIDLDLVTGTGQGGRITKKDVLAYIEKGKSTPELAPWETMSDSGGDLFRPTDELFKPPSGVKPAPTTQFGDETDEGTIVPLNTMRKLIAKHMVYSKSTAPHVTTVMEADLGRVAAHRQAHKGQYAKDPIKLTYTPYFIGAVVAGLKAFPVVNSSWREAGVLIKKQINIGMAVAIEPDGLIVPVVKGADGISLLGLSRVVNDLAARARDGKLKPDEVKGGTFTITNHGVFGSLFATPIINQPECAILGLGAIKKRVVVVGDAIAIRPMVYLSLTFDHRILDGATADKFLAKVVEHLENWI